VTEVSAPEESDGRSLDWDQARREVKGDPELLKMMVETALEEAPRLLGQIREAVAGADPAALKLAAHTLKGSIRYFGQTLAYQQAFRLEKMGQDKQLEGAGEVLSALEGEMALLRPLLLHYGRQGDTAGD